MKVFGSILGKIGRLLARIFSRRTGDMLRKLAPIAAPIVQEYLESDKPGPEKKKEAFHRIEEIAIRRGIPYATHAINQAIEYEVTKAAGDPLEQVLDEGLEIVKGAVKTVDGVLGNVDQDESLLAVAFDSAKEALLKNGKEWLTSTRLINLLIAYAISALRR